MAKNIKILWLRGESKGYTDLLPLAWFLNNPPDLEKRHDVVGLRGGIYKAGFRLTLSSREAKLDYTCETFRHLNDRNGMYRGVMQIRFADPARTRVVGVRWDGKELIPKDVSVSIGEVEIQANIIGEIIRQQFGYTPKKVRQGQAKFRKNVGLAYGEKCCISRCEVPFALVAAHIAPYADIPSNRTRNGLLMRADLHILFDTNQMAIDPLSRLVHFSPEARTWPEYNRMHRRKRLAAPQDGYLDHAPTTAALQDRWKKFVKCNP